MLRPLLSRSRAFHPTASQAVRILGQPWRSSRSYSIPLEAASRSKPQDIIPSKLVVTKTQNPGTLRKPEELVFGNTFTGMLSPDPLH